VRKWYNETLTTCTARATYMRFADTYYCQTPSMTQTNKETNEQTPGIEFGAF